jgi:hypothetical protein
LLQPKANDIHNYLSETPLNMIPDFHFETLILAGEFLGIKDRLFQEIFSFEPWLNHVKKQD